MAVRNCAHQHVEAAIAAKRDYLPRFVERLDAVRLPHRRADGAIVEGTDDALRTALPDVIGGPQRVQARIEHKDGVLGRKFAHRACHCLWMDSIRASAEIGLAIELFIPLPALTAHPFEKAIVLLFGHLVQQQLDRRLDRAGGGEGGRSAPPSTSARSSIWIALPLPGK